MAVRAHRDSPCYVDGRRHPQQVGARRQIASPQNLCVCARLSPTAVRLTWSDPGALAQNYIIQRSTVEDFSSSAIEIRIAKNTLEFADETATYGVTFYYRSRRRPVPTAARLARRRRPTTGPRRSGPHSPAPRPMSA